VTSDGVSSSSRVGWMPAEHVTGLKELLQETLIERLTSRVLLQAVVSR
jgi:hypothetical protein